MVEARLAKITRPRLHGSLPRERLFGLLDERRRHPVVWLCATPGAGKTTLVASYLDSRRLPCIWFQADEGDNDPATFIYYLALAAPRKPRPLPLLTPEYQADLSGFARRYFRDLFGRLPQGTSLVFDNYQHLARDSIVHTLISGVVEEIPHGLNLIVISRENPPSAYARHIAHGTVAFIEWEDLRLTLEETSGIASAGRAHTPHELQVLHQTCGGWAAGLTLMLERLRRTGSLHRAAHDQSMEVAFDYFAGQFFDHASPDLRELLMRTALAPRITAALAREITGNERADELLESLHRRHVFTDRIDGEVATYQYHALFREFLCSRARTNLGPDECWATTTQAARLLELAGQHEDALALSCESGDWESATRLTLQCAEVMLRHGRGQVLREWIARIPGPLRLRNPWLDYWSGLSLAPIDPAEARTRLVPAYNRFVAQHDPVGQVLSAAAVVEAYYYEWSNFRPLDSWIRVFEDLLCKIPAFPSREAELQAYGNYLLALSRRQPDHPALPVVVERTLHLLELPLDANQRVIAATILMNFYHQAMDFDSPHRLITLVQPVLADQDVTALNRAFWISRLALWLWRTRAYEESAAAVEEGIQLASDNGLSRLLTWLHFGRQLVYFIRGDVVRLEYNAHCMERNADVSRLVDMFQLNVTRAELALRRHDSKAAERHLKAMVEFVDRSGAVFPQSRARVWLAAVVAQHGDEPAARRLVAETRALVSTASLRYLLHQCVLVEAFLSLQGGERAVGLGLLRSAFADREGIASINDFVLCARSLMSSLCDAAIRSGIEVETAQELVREYRLPPLVWDLESWPWPIKISVLGSFSVLKDGQPLPTRGKSPTRLLQLLKIILTGGGSSLSASAVAARLWVDVDGDAAEQNLDMALSRLRRLLGPDATVILRDNKLMLDPSRCWVDAWVFESLARQAHSASGTQLIEIARRALDLYRGPFLGEEDAAWVLPYRERLRHSMLELVQLAGDACIAKGGMDEAAELYARSLALESLAEPLYRRLMLVHRARGEHAEALEVYRKCTEMLSAQLGAHPSPETQAVYASLAGIRASDSHLIATHR